MRFVAFAIIIAILPMAVSMLRQNRALHKWAYLLLGFLPFTGSSLNFDASLVAWPFWPGYARGTTWSVVNSIAAALLIVSDHVLPTPDRIGSEKLEVAELEMGRIALSALGIHHHDSTST